MKSTNKLKFKSIDVDTDSSRGVIFRNPFPYKYEPMTSRRELIKAWNEECRIRAAELEIYHNDINNYQQ